MRRRRGRNGNAIAAVVVLLLLASACGGGKPESQSQGDITTTGAESAQAPGDAKGAEPNSAERSSGSSASSGSRATTNGGASSNTGGEPSNTGGAPGAPATNSPAYKGAVGVTKSSLTIGLIYPQSGAFGPFLEQYPKVYQAAFNDINDREGGIFGRKLGIATGDEGESASLAQASARRLSSRVFGLTTFVQEEAVVAVSEDVGIPTMTLVGNIAPGALNGKHKYSFVATTPNPHFEPRNGPSLIKAKFPKLVDRTALVYTGDAYAAAGPAFLKTAKRHGVNVIHTEKLVLNQTTCVNSVANVQAARPEIVWLYSSSLEAACFLRDARAAGFRPQWSGRLAQITNTASGNSNEGMVGVTYIRGINSPEGKRLQATYRKYYPNDPLKDIEPNLIAWAGAQMWIQWLKATGPQPTRDGFVKALENHGPFPSGMIHPPDFAPGVHVGSEHTIAGVVRDGNVVITDDVWKTTYDGVKDPPYFPWK